MPERKVKILAFPYYRDEEDRASGRKVRRELIASRDEVVDFHPDDVERGERFDVFYSESQTEAGEEAFDPSTATEQELQAWIEEDAPTVTEVIEASGGDPDVARRLLTAETAATGDNARKTVVEGLGAVISRGQ